MARKHPLLLGAVAFLLAGAVRGQEKPFEQLTVPLTWPDKPGKLVIERHQGSISVTGYEGRDILVKATFRRPPDPAGPGNNAGGMKPVSTAAIQLDAREADNIVTIDAHSRTKSIDLEILVPVRFSVKLGVRDDGDVAVRSLRGDAEVDNPYGRVSLERLTGSANVNSVDGDIIAGFLGVEAGVPLALTTVHGKIDVAFPAGAALTIRMKSDEGMIYSDFEIAVEKRRTRTEPALKAGEKRIALEEWTTGRIGPGGTDVLLQSFDGNIYIRHNLFPAPL